MAFRHRRYNVGFTLIEAMIVVAVVSILGTIAYSSYSAQTLKARRSDAQSALLGLAQAMERQKTETGSYVFSVTAALPAPGLPAAPIIFPSQSPLDGGIKYYDLMVTAVTASTYTLQAIPIAGGAQAGDGFIQLMSTGVRGWDRDDVGGIDPNTEQCWQMSC